MELTLPGRISIGWSVQATVLRRTLADIQNLGHGHNNLIKASQALPQIVDLAAHADEDTAASRWKLGHRPKSREPCPA